MQVRLARIVTALQRPPRIRERSFGSLLCLVLIASIVAPSGANGQQFPPPVFEPAPPAPLPAPGSSTPATAPVFAPPPALPAATPFPPPAPAAAAPVFVAPAFPATGMSAQPGVSPQASMKVVFANTLALAAQATGTTLVTGIVGAITGGITEWFANRRKTAPMAAATADATSAPSTMPPALPAAMPTAAAAIAPPPVFAPLPAADPAAPLPGPGPQFFDPSSGTAVAPDPVFLAAPVADSADATLFAGLAYEVHAVTSGGGTTPVNPAFHEFHTGDRFVVFYRPTVPGHMEVYNINPAGIQTQIDSAQLAGGQLERLGPYEFAGTKGDDRLRLVLTPCSTPDLLLATRDIIKVPAATELAAATPAVGAGLPACGLVTRSTAEPVTRDIRKVALEGTTAFALDPVSAQESASGRLDMREVTIVFRHR